MIIKYLIIQILGWLKCTLMPFGSTVAVESIAGPAFQDTRLRWDMRAQNNNRVVISYFSLSKTLASSCIKISRFSKFLHCMYDGGKGGVGAAHGTISTREFFFTFFTKIWYKHWTCISQLDFVVKFLDLNCIFLQDNVQEVYWVDGYVQIIHVNNWTGTG